MARGRLISKTLGTSSKRFVALATELGRLGEFGQALYPLLVASSDDFGRLDGDSFTVKHSVWPTSPRSDAEFGTALEGMAKVGLVQRYRVKGRIYLQIHDFSSHQPGLHKRTVSRFPECPGSSRKLPEIPSQEKGREVKGSRREEEENRSEGDDADASGGGGGFAEFWLAYPRKDNRKDALKAWKALHPTNGTKATILADIQRRIRSEPWLKDGGKFIPYGGSYLRGERWTDPLTAPSVTDRELHEAAELRRKAYGRCPHEPACDSYADCVRALAEDRKAKSA